MLHHLRPVLVAGALALLALPASAVAAPGARSFQTTFPRAAALCAKADAGTLPKRLANSAAQVQTACEAMKGAFNAASDSYVNATAGLMTQAQAIIAGAQAACAQAFADRNPAGCRTARQQARAALQPIIDQLRAAGRARRASLDAARKAFWKTVGALAGATAPPTTDPPPPPPDPIGIT